MDPDSRRKTNSIDGIPDEIKFRIWLLVLRMRLAGCHGISTNILCKHMIRTAQNYISRDEFYSEIITPNIGWIWWNPTQLKSQANYVIQTVIQLIGKHVLISAA